MVVEKPRLIERRWFQVVLFAIILGVFGSFLGGEAAACEPATPEDLSYLASELDPPATTGLVVDRGDHRFLAFETGSGVAVFANARLSTASPDAYGLIAAANDEARAISEFGADIGEGSEAYVALGLDDAEGIAAAEACYAS